MSEAFIAWASKLKELKREKPRQGARTYAQVGGWVRVNGKVMGSVHQLIKTAERFFVPVPGGAAADASKVIAKKFKWRTVRASPMSISVPVCYHVHSLSCMPLSQAMSTDAVWLSDESEPEENYFKEQLATTSPPSAASSRTVEPVEPLVEPRRSGQ